MQALPSVIETKQQKPVRQDIIDSLRSYVYAQYDSATTGIRRVDLPELENRLEEKLKEIGMPAGAMQNLREGNRVRELEAFFEEQGLLFRAIKMPGQSSKVNYELLKVDSKEQKELTVFGTTKKFTKIRFVEQDVITNSFTYEVQRKKNAGTYGVAHGAWFDVDAVEFRVWQNDLSVKNYFEGEKAYFDVLEKEAKDTALLDKYVGGKKVYSKDLFNRLGTLLHHIAVRDIYRSSKDENDFREKITPIWEKESETRNAMLLIDYFEYDKEIVEKLSGEDRRSLGADMFGQRETRALLAQMFYGNPHQYLGDMFKLIATNTEAEVALKEMASWAVLTFFKAQIIVDRKTFSNIDVSDPSPTAIYKQFGLLTADQIRNLTKDTFEGLYHGKSLRECMQPRLNELFKKYH